MDFLLETTRAAANSFPVFRVLNSVEAYNPVLDRWDPVAALSIGRIGMGVTSYRGLIMVAGGYHDICTNTSGKHVLGTVELYDPTTDW